MTAPTPVNFEYSGCRDYCKSHMTCVPNSPWWLGTFLTVSRKRRDTSRSTSTSRLRPPPPAHRRSLSPNWRKRGKTLWVCARSCITTQPFMYSHVENMCQTCRKKTFIYPFIYLVTQLTITVLLFQPISIQFQTVLPSVHLLIFFSFFPHPCLFPSLQVLLVTRS